MSSTTGNNKKPPIVKCLWKECDKFLPLNQLKRCGKCRVVYYCGVECQKKDWVEHKKICVPYDGAALSNKDKTSTLAWMANKFIAFEMLLDEFVQKTNKNDWVLRVIFKKLDPFEFNNTVQAYNSLQPYNKSKNTIIATFDSVSNQYQTCLVGIMTRDEYSRDFPERLQDIAMLKNAEFDKHVYICADKNGTSTFVAMVRTTPQVKQDFTQLLSKDNITVKEALAMVLRADAEDCATKARQIPTANCENIPCKKQLPKYKMTQCEVCQSAYYCSKDCKKEHASEHRNFCIQHAVLAKTNMFLPKWIKLNAWFLEYFIQEKENEAGHKNWILWFDELVVDAVPAHEKDVYYFAVRPSLCLRLRIFSPEQFDSLFPDFKLRLNEVKSIVYRETDTAIIYSRYGVDAIGTYGKCAPLELDVQTTMNKSKLKAAVLFQGSKYKILDDVDNDDEVAKQMT